MRKRLLVFVPLLVLVGGIAFSPVSSSIPKNTATAPKAIPAVTQQQQPVDDPPGTIRGDQHPELISDYYAYLAMFRMLSNRQTEDERNSIRAYVRGVIGLGKQRGCPKCRQSVGVGDADIDTLIGAADEFYQRVSIIEQEATGIKDRSWPNGSAADFARLTKLQAQKEALVAEVAASLPQRLSKEGLQRLRQHIRDTVKQRIILTPAPATPPGSHGWQHDPSHN